MAVENVIINRDCFSQKTALPQKVVYGIFLQDLADPRDAAGLQFGGTSGRLLCSDAGLQCVRARFYPT